MKDYNPINLGNDRNDIELDSLNKYIQTYILDKNKLTYSKIGQCLIIPPRTFLALVGAISGIPWIQSAAGSASVLPVGKWRDVFKVVSAVGVVINVGAQGLWIMLEVGSHLSIRAVEEKKLTNYEKNVLERVSSGVKIILPVGSALCASVAPVYASIVFNEGYYKLFAIITFFRTFGSGVYGYSKFFSDTFDIITGTSKKIFCRQNTNSPIEVQFRDQLISGLDVMLNEPYNKFFTNLNRIDTPDNLINYILSKKIEKSSSFLEGILKNIFTYIPALTVTLSSSMVDYYLIRDLMKKIVDSEWFATPSTFFIMIPGMVTTFVSTMGTFNSLLKFLTKNHISIHDEQDPVFSKMLAFLVFLLSLTAPAAAAYITYSTLEKEGVPFSINLISIISISFARVFYGHFTMTESLGNGIEQAEISSGNQVVDNYRRMRDLKKILGDTNPKQLKSLAESKRNLFFEPEELNREVVESERSWCEISIM